MKFCPTCGKEIEDGATFCPHCGAPVGQTTQQPTQQYTQPVQQSQSNGFAIAGFVCSFFFSIVGLILSIIGLNKSKTLGGNGRGLAIAGIVISAIGFVLSIFVLFGVIGGALAAISSGMQF